MKTGFGGSIPADARRHGTRLRLDNGTAEKAYHSEWEARMERVKSTSACELAASTGTFRVPQVIASTATSTTWELISGITPLRRELSREPRADLSHRAGQVLATIHRSLELPHDVRVRAAGRWAENCVPVHGDFGLTNVQYQPDTDELVVLDWATARWLGPPFTHAHAHLEIAMFLVDLYYQRPADPLRIRGTDDVASAFLAGYTEVRSLDNQRLRADSRHVMARFLWRAQTGLRRALRLPSLARLDRLLRAQGRHHPTDSRPRIPGSGR